MQALYCGFWIYVCHGDCEIGSKLPMLVFIDGFLGVMSAGVSYHLGVYCSVPVCLDWPRFRSPLSPPQHFSTPRRSAHDLLSHTFRPHCWASRPHPTSRHGLPSGRPLESRYSGPSLSPPDHWKPRPSGLAFPPDCC